MKVSKKLLIAITFIIIMLISSMTYCHLDSKNEYSPKVLVIYKKGTNGYTDIYQNYKQSYILNAQVKAIDDSTALASDLTQFDVVYPDISLLTSSNLNKIRPILLNYTSKGGGLFLENEWMNSFPSNFTGVSTLTLNTSDNPSFTYPSIDYNLEQFQTVTKSFLDNFTQYRKKDFSYLKFGSNVLNGATSIANSSDGSILSVNKYQKGYVLMASNLLPNKSLITGFDFKAKETDQKYFDYTLSTANYFIRNEFLGFILKEKDGYVLKKVFGSYGRPSMAWQNHYEALSPIGNKEMIKWIDLLKDYNEVPSFSLVRSAYDWGQWKADIAVHLNIGSKESPKFQGEYENSYYSSGQRIEGDNDYITFGNYTNYASLNDPITLPFRAYPTVIDYNNDEKKDLVVGSMQGKLYLLKNVGTQNKSSFNDKEEIKLSKDVTNKLQYAAPFAYDINKDGLFDLVVGDDSGFVNILINNGSITSPNFSSLEHFKDIYGRPIKVSDYGTPCIGDIDGDGMDDLVLGSGIGNITLYKGASKGFVYKGVIIKDTNDKFSSPAIYDYNCDGTNDILVGGNGGMVKIYLNNGTFTYSGNVQCETLNPAGNNSLLGGHNSVPVVTDWNNDGKPDILLGQVEFGTPYDIDGKYFPYKKELKESIAYAKKFEIPIYPHFFTHKYKSPSQEKTELALQKKSFDNYGLKWTGGIDQHTWRINNLDPVQTFKSEINSGIWWNFGFNPPNQPDLPRDGKEFLWSTPFLLGNGENTENFLTFTPSPDLFIYPDAYKSFAALDMPVTYFEHIEYAFTSGPGKLPQLKQMAEFLNETRDNGEYNFMTQEQMAKSFINTLYSKADISNKGDEILIKENLNDVPSLSGEYKGTLGIKFEKGKKYKDKEVFVSSPIYFKKNGDLYFGLLGNAKISFKKPKNQNLHMVRSNVPIEITNFKDTSATIKFLSDGMQQIKIYSDKQISIQGENIKIQKEGKYYTVTHYGKAITVRVGATTLTP